MYFYIHHSFLIGYTCISEFFVPLKCSICFCFIACHNSLSSPVCTLLNLFFFMYMTAIYLIMHPHLRFMIGISPCFVQILFYFCQKKYSLPISPSFIPFSSLWNISRNIRKAQLILCWNMIKCISLHQYVSHTFTGNKSNHFAPSRVCILIVENTTW